VHDKELFLSLLRFGPASDIRYEMIGEDSEEWEEMVLVADNLC
jgi:hypothetical protein